MRRPDRTRHLRRRIAVLAIAGVLLLTMTDFGRGGRRFRADNHRHGHGQVRIGGIGGNLLDGVVMTDFSIADTAGRPFVTAERSSPIPSHRVCEEAHRAAQPSTRQAADRFR